MDEIFDEIMDTEFLSDPDFRDEVIAEQGWRNFQKGDLVEFVGTPPHAKEYVYTISKVKLVAPQGFGPNYHHQLLELTPVNPGPSNPPVKNVSGSLVQPAILR